MIDINTSHDYDEESFRELLAEERKRAATADSALAGGLFSAPGITGNALADRAGVGRSNALAGAFGTLGSTGNVLADLGVAGGSNALAGVFGVAPGGLAGRATDAFIEKARADSAREITDPIDFLKKHYPGQRLWRFIHTHPDLDHMRGLKRLHETIGFTNYWDTAHTKATPNFRGDGDREDWQFYQALRTGAVEGPKVLRFSRGDRYFAFGCEEDGRLGGDNMEILSPSPAFAQSCNQTEGWNDLSIVVRVWHGGKSLLLPGDVRSSRVEGDGRISRQGFEKRLHESKPSRPRQRL